MSKDAIRKSVQACVAQMPQRSNVKKISLFGSQLHGEASADSDVDLLIELEEPVGYFELVNMQRRLSESVGREVDLVTPKALSKYFRDEVLASAEALYEK